MFAFSLLLFAVCTVTAQIPNGNVDINLRVTLSQLSSYAATEKDRAEESFKIKSDDFQKYLETNRNQLDKRMKQIQKELNKAPKACRDISGTINDNYQIITNNLEDIKKTDVVAMLKTGKEVSEVLKEMDENAANAKKVYQKCPVACLGYIGKVNTIQGYIGGTREKFRTALNANFDSLMMPATDRHNFAEKMLNKYEADIGKCIASSN